MQSVGILTLQARKYKARYEDQADGIKEIQRMTGEEPTGERSSGKCV